jgi:predicted NUDIX family phosphoesterase
MTTTQVQLSMRQDVLQESVLVVKREYLFPEESWQGICTENVQRYLNIIAAKKEFLPRHLAEQDPRYKQIIPYLIFTHNAEIFVMQRRANASETRLQNKYTIGIGGHIRQEDIKSNDIFDWANREFHEEVTYDDAMTIEPLGILNDDSNDVGKVHMGFVFLIHGHSNTISVRSELKSGSMLSLDSCIALHPHFETWSQIALQKLIDTNKCRPAVPCEL